MTNLQIVVLGILSVIALAVMITAAVKLVKLASIPKGSKSTEPSKEQAPESEVPLNISEPVLSFVECVRSNHRRFKFKSEFFFNKLGGHTVNYFIDTQLAIKYEYTIFRTISREDWGHFEVFNLKIKNHLWLTQDELNYLYEEISKVYAPRMQRLAEISEKRAGRERLRKNRLMRQKYIDLYCVKEATS